MFMGHEGLDHNLSLASVPTTRSGTGCKSCIGHAHTAPTRPKQTDAIFCDALRDPCLFLLRCGKAAGSRYSVLPYVAKDY